MDVVNLHYLHIIEFHEHNNLKIFLFLFLKIYFLKTISGVAYGSVKIYFNETVKASIGLKKTNFYYQ